MDDIYDLTWISDVIINNHFTNAIKLLCLSILLFLNINKK